MHRPSIGIIAIVLLGVAAVLWLFQVQDGGWTAACFRVGIVMSVLWLAQPELSRLPAWLVLGVVAVLFVTAWRPRLLLFAVIILVLYAILRPRQRKRAARAGGGSGAQGRS